MTELSTPTAILRISTVGSSNRGSRTAPLCQTYPARLRT